ncbi:MAG: hypothetical protein ACFBSF_12150 [Leptolyngbyaceae cyanobacterium]
MSKRYLLLCISTFCLLSACGSGTPTAEDLSSEPAPDTAAESEPNSTSDTSASDSTDESVPQAAEPAVEAGPSTAETRTETSQANAPSAAGQLLEDTLIVPGERVGPVTQETTRADLAELYGEAALEDTEIPVGEGFTESGTIVNGDSDETFSVIWTDETQTEPSTLVDFGPAWQTVEGVQLGTSFDELKDTLGSFSLYGFGWDYEGTVVLEESDLEEYYGLLLLRVRPETDAIKQFPDAYQAVSGDKLLSSDDPNLPPLNLSVYEMIVYVTPLIQ